MTNPNRRLAAAAFEPLNPQPAYGRVSAAIEARIVERTLRPGDRLPTEAELARQFAVNRSTVREALRRLESAGLVGRPGGGKTLFVTGPAQAETATRVSRTLALQDVTVYELWEAMLAIAPRTAALAAAHADVAGHQRLRAAALEPDSSQPARTAVARVVGYFRTLAELSGNRVLMLAHEPVTELLAPSLARLIDRLPQARLRIADAQQRICDAVAAGESEDAQAWMARHVQDFRRGYELAAIALDTPAA